MEGAPCVTLAPVLSGGMLSSNVVPETCVRNGVHFLRMVWRDSKISKFLTGKRRSDARRPELFQTLASLRNEATLQTFRGGGGETDECEDNDLGVDDELAMAPKTTRGLSRKALRTHRLLARRASATISIEFEGRSMLVLSGVGKDDVWLEFTTDNMRFLFDRSRPSPVGTETSTSAESPEAGGDASNDDLSIGLDQEIPKKVSGFDQVSPTRQVKRLRQGTPSMTWNVQRTCWIVRYTAENNTKRQKRFGADKTQDDDDVGKLLAKQKAELFIESLPR